MSTVIKSPELYDFTGRMEEIVLDSDVTISVACKANGKLILDEEYSPDANNIIRMRGLRNLCGLCLWGESLNYRGEQVHHGAQFSFTFGGGQTINRWLYLSNRWTKKAPSVCGPLTDCRRRITYPGTTEIVSGFPWLKESVDENDDTSYHSYITYHVTTADGRILSREELLNVDGSMEYAYTIETGVEELEQRFGVSGITQFAIEFNGGKAEFLVCRDTVPRLINLRFRNLYDLPEMLHCTGDIQFEAANESETNVVDGISRKYGIKPKDSYKLLSGAMRLGEEFRLWRDLVNSNEVELYVEEYGWVPILITKQKLQSDLHRQEFKEAEVTFEIADAHLAGLDHFFVRE